MNDPANALLHALLRISLLTQLMFYRGLLAVHPQSQVGFDLHDMVGGRWTVHPARAVADIDRSRGDGLDDRRVRENH